MIEVLIFVFCVLFAMFNFWAITKGWKAQFGKVTRGEAFFHGILAMVLPVGFIIALIELAQPRVGNSWSRFWSKPFL